MALHTMNDLRQRQALPLDIKVRMTQQRIREWVNEFGVDGVYVSFSGGKDSTVLLHLVREMYPEIPAVFIDTGLEYPEIREFVKTFDNVEWVRPKMNFKQVIKTYGYPFISKEVSNCVDGARKYLAKLHQMETGLDCNTIPYACYMADIMGIDRREDKNNPEFIALRSGEISNYRLARLLGELKNKEDGPSKFNQTRYAFFLDAPFNISDRCCNVMKKRPVHAYEKRTGRKPIIATMAEESQLRTQKWLHEGCNAFDGKYPHSKPMSFWKNQDVLKYIKDNNIQLASVYGKVVPDINPNDFVSNQIKLWDMPNEQKCEVLKTTGCKRTGCAMCMFGGQIDVNRIADIAKVSRPEISDYVFRGGTFDERGLWVPDKIGLGYWFVMKWINIHGRFNMNIPNFEEYEKKYGNEKTHQYLYGDTLDD